MGGRIARSEPASAGPLRRRKLKSERLRSHLLSQIAAGSLNPGDALVAERHLAEVMKMSRTTVRQALDDMERDGIIHRVGRKGTFIADPQIREIGSQSAAMAIVVLDVSARYYVSLLAGFEESCRHAGHPAIVCNSGDSIDRQGNYLMGLLSQRVSGVVLNACSVVTTPPYHVELLQDAGIPVVLLHRAIPNVNAPLLEMPGEAIGQKAARMLIDAGHRQVACFDSYRGDLSARYEFGFRASLANAGIELPDSRVCCSQAGSWDYPTAQDDYDKYLAGVLPKLLSQPNRPTAIYAFFDPIAEHLYLAAQKLGLRVPEDLSIVSVGGAHRDGVILKRLTSIVIDEVEAGKKAVELVEEMRCGRRPINDSETFCLPLSVYDGETLGPPPSATHYT